MKYTVCIYCGSSDEAASSFRAAAAGAVKALAAGGADLIYGGGFHGLMGEVARASLEAGVPLTGIVPARFKSDRSIPPKGIEYRFVDTMQDRKTMMRDLSQGFVALPGGIGTLDEILETLMMRSLGFHAKPLALLNIRGFFDPLLSMLERLVSENFLKASMYESLIVSEDAADLAGRLFAALG